MYLPGSAFISIMIAQWQRLENKTSYHLDQDWCQWCHWCHNWCHNRCHYSDQMAPIY